MTLALTGACIIDYPEIADAEKICTPGDSVFCRCPNGAPGTKACGDDGISFRECGTRSGAACGEDDLPNDLPSPPDDPPPGTKGGQDPPIQGGGGSGAGGGGGGSVSDCGTIDYYGECSGDQLSWCDEGVLVETDCMASERVCQLVDDTIGYDCVTPADPCEGVTFEGECDGDTLRYCGLDEIVEIDCAAQNQVCGAPDDSSFYSCIDASAQ